MFERRFCQGRSGVTKPEKLNAIAEAIKAGLGAEQAAKVSFYTPDNFIAELRKLAEQIDKAAKPSTPQERMTSGYKVRDHSPTLTPEERKAKEEVAIRIMAETMKRTL